MRARDYLDFPLLVIGVNGVMLGHHWFGLIWFWLGVAVTAFGLAIVSSGGLEEKIDRALRSHRGPGDYGNRDYHGGSSNFTPVILVVMVAGVVIDSRAQPVGQPRSATL